MTPQELNAVRLEELTRRVSALPDEVDAWIERSGPQAALKIHNTQIRALGLLIAALVKKQQDLLATLAADAPDFSNKALQIVRDLIRTQRIWGFFRAQLSLRFSEDYQKPLWVADTIAWNCHRSVLEEAQKQGILTLDQSREPPLTYVVADVSPLAYARGSQPTEGDRLLLGGSVLPIPIIHVPPDQLVNAWQLLTIAHEVAHSLEKDLGLQTALDTSLKNGLTAAGRTDRLDQWLAWRSEVFADLVAVQLVGPAFGRAMLAALALPDALVTSLNADDEHPMPYMRVLMLAAYMRTVVEDDGTPAVAAVRAKIDADAAALEADWKVLYPDAPAEAAPLLDDAPHVWKALMNKPFPELKTLTVRQLIPFKAAHDLRIREAAAYLATGQNAPPPARFKDTIRHCIAAAQIAVDAGPQADLESYLRTVDERARALVVDNTPDVVRGSASKTHDAYISKLATLILDEEP